MSILSLTSDLPAIHRALFDQGQELVKQGGELAPAYAMSGLLYLSSSGYLLLTVPSALARGVFAALDEPGLQLPLGPNGEEFNAHITVMRPEEITALGGPEQITERGKRFRYRLGGLVTTEPDDFNDVSRIWMLRVYSTELQNLRKSYGLTPLPNSNRYDFHITIAVRKRGVLSRGTTTKVTSPVPFPGG